MTDVDRIRTVRRAAAARLHAIRGVHAVGVGFKVVTGKKTDELAITVFVDRKKKPEELSAREIIPSEIDGVKTDVVQMGRARLANADPTSITVAVATIPPGQEGGQRITVSGPKIPADGLIAMIDLTVQGSGEDARQVFVSASTNGQSTLLPLRDDLLDALDKLDEASPSSSDDPLQIQVLAVLDATVKVTNAYVVAEDDTEYFKDYVRGGIQIQRGSATPSGTLGIVATTAPTADDPKGKVVGLTNVHVVCPSDADGTNLQVTDDDDSMGVTFAVRLQYL